MEKQISLEDLGKRPYKIEKPIRLIELFAGYGSQLMGLKRLGADVESWKVVEFDKYAIASYNAIHGTNYPTIDITTVKGEDLEIIDKDKFEYVLTYSFPCFTKDTLVLTKDGYKEIQNINVNDQVLSHDNQYHKVTKSMATGIKEIYRIKGMAFDEIKTTENHKFYARKLVRHYPTYPDGRRGRLRTFLEPEWVECRDLDKSYYLGVAINQNSIIPTWDGIDFEWSDGRKTRHKNELGSLMNNHSFWWLIGRYLGDGWTRCQGGIIICCAKNEVHEITPHIRNCGFNYCITEDRTVNRIDIPLKELSNFVSAFGKGAEGKKIPSFVFDMPISLLQSLIEGYVSADGYAEDNQGYKITSVSRELIYGVAQLVAKAYKAPYRIYRTKRKDKCVIEGRICNQKDSFELVWKNRKSKQDQAFYEDGYIWFPIREIKNTHQYEEVYDITVEDAHSFTANGTIVHNCTDISVAGLQKGMSKGSGTRSGLLWQVERLLTELGDNLPQILVLENVTQLHGKKNMADFQAWIDFLSSLGYSSFYQDMNGKDYGVAQNRDRTFMVSILDPNKEFTYEFPQPIELKKCMKDYLEDEVDEKYYINNARSEKLIKELMESGKLDNYQ